MVLYDNFFSIFDLRCLPGINVISTAIFYNTADILKTSYYFEKITMPRVVKVAGYGRIGMHIWKLPDGKEQQVCDRNRKAESDERKRICEDRGGASKEASPDPLRWVLSYDIFEEVSRSLLPIFPGC
jgi:hypothetical protein